jgi:sugar lactone lactonase YvrE
MIFDTSGTLFLTAGNTGQILSITPDGTQSIFASGLVNPRGLAFDAGGNLYVAEGGSGSIYKYTTSGTRSTYATGLSGANGIAFDSSGNLFVGTQSTITEVAPDGTQSVFASGFGSPTDLTFDSAGNLFFGAITTNAVILKITPGGSQSVFAGKVFASGLAFDDHGNLWAATIDALDEYAPDGTGGIVWQDGARYSAIAFQVPEPSALGLLLIGSLVLLSSRRSSRPPLTGLA